MATTADTTAAEILRAARRNVGLTGRELARASGVAESRISDYEHGRHQPSAARLQRLLAATGHDLAAVPRARVDPERNARVFADVLSLVDAIPFPALTEGREQLRPPPPTWAELISGRAPRRARPRAADQNG